MAWVKIPKEHHPLFMDAVPSDPRVSTLKMFGGIGATVNGHMFGGLWARSVMVKLSPADQKKALAIGAVPFDPMGNGRVMADSFVLPEGIVDDAEELRDWLKRALAFTATLPPKTKKPAAKKPAAAKEPAKPRAKKK
ncbi:MAG: TfoX/Sxy family protein [Deltaproteobacteria bacterium]|nr:TfoX/Sxy family protein [Deltaproteobacteria bacterium]